MRVHHSGQISPEAELLLCTSRIDMSPVDIERARELLDRANTSVDWGVFFHLAAKHRVLPLVGRNFDRHSLGPIGEMRHHVLRASYLFSICRSNAFGRELAFVLAALDSHHVNAVLRKGVFLAEYVYPEPGIRYMTDFDLFVPRDAIELLKTVMHKLGYTQGRDSADRRTITPLPRELELFWSLHVGELPPFIRLTSDPYVDVFVIDVRHDMMEPGTGKSVSAIEIRDAAASTRIRGVPAWILRPEYMLLDLAVHIYREATTLATIAAGKDLCLYRFLDIIEFYKWAKDRLVLDDFVELTEKHQASDEVFYALHFADMIYPDVLPQQLMSVLAPKDRAYLDEYGTLDGQRQSWTEPFLKRLFDRNRERSVTVRSSLLRPRGQRGET